MLSSSAPVLSPKTRPDCGALLDSPLFDLAVPENGFLLGEGFSGVKGTGPAVAYGCWVLLEPLSPGEHTITIEGTFPLKPKWFSSEPKSPGEPFTFTQSATYTLTVV